MPQTIYFNGKKYNSVAEMPSNEREMYEKFNRFLEDADRDGVPDMLQSGGLSGLKDAFGMIKDIAQISSSQGVKQEQFTIIKENESGININGKRYRSVDEMSPGIRKVYNEITQQAREGDYNIYDEAWREVDRDEYFQPHDDEILNQQFPRQSMENQNPIDTIDSNSRLIFVLAIGLVLIGALVFMWFLLF